MPCARRCLLWRIMRRTLSKDSEFPAEDSAFAPKQRLASTRMTTACEFISTILGWPNPRGQAELVHFGEVRLRRPLGTGSPHQASDSIRSADDDWYRNFVYADGTRPPRRRAHSRAESGTGRSQAARR